jgi:hypothetical protein
VLSFHLEDRQANALRSAGVIVSRRLDAEVVHRLLGLPPGGAAEARPAT